jgi:hypothetical protein
MATEDLVSTATRLLNGEELTVENCLRITFELMNAAEEFSSMSGQAKKDMVIDAILRCMNDRVDERILQLVKDFIPLAIDAHHGVKFLKKGKCFGWC